MYGNVEKQAGVPIKTKKIAYLSNKLINDIMNNPTVVHLLLKA